MKTSVSKNTEDIAHHIRRTDGLQDLYSSNRQRIDSAEERLDKLEEPVKAKAWVKDHMVTLLSVLTAIGSLAAFLYEKFGK